MSQAAEKTVARVSAATALTERQRMALSDMLSMKLKKPVEIVVQTDPTLIGGLYIHVDGRIMDRTVKKQIHDMKISLRKRGVR